MTGVFSRLVMQRKNISKYLSVAIGFQFLLFGFPITAPANAAGTPAITAPSAITSTAASTTTDITGVAVSGLTTGSTYSVSLSISNTPTSAGLKLTSVTGLTASYGYSVSANTVFTSTSFYGSLTNVNAALATLKYYSGVGGLTPSITVTVSEYTAGVAYNPTNGHYYVARTGGSYSGVTWSQANTAASGSTYLGQAGYLVTITTLNEQNFVSSKIQNASNIWIGHSDATTEGVWRIDSTNSPENGKAFWRASCTTVGLTSSCSQTSSYSSSGVNVTSDGISYNNWCSGEPNNSDGTAGEDYAVTNWNGNPCWNDLRGGNTGQIGGYVIEYGTNDSGGGFAASASATITVNTAPKISYSPSSITTSIYASIATATPTNSGTDTTTVYSISPALPAGFTLNTATGAITGAATTVFTATSYTITATNSYGTSSTSISLTSNASKISYSPSSITGQTGQAISPVRASNTGSTNVSYSISPTLPAGLSFNTTNGQISGTPTETSTATVYTVTATYTGITYSGSSTQYAKVTITVNAIKPQISYTGLNGGAVTVQVGKDKNFSLTPTNAGGVATSWSISPVSTTPNLVDVGLTFNTSNGVLSGTTDSMTSLSVPQTLTYQVTATNDTGSDSATVEIYLVEYIPAPNISYPNSNTVSLNYGIAITSPITPTNTGGLANSWSISPSLPAGLTFNTTNGTITGAALAPAANPAGGYTVSATNDTGTATVVINLSVDGSANVDFDNSPILYSGLTLTILPTANPFDSQTFTYAVVEGGCTISSNVLSTGSSTVGSTCKVKATASATAIYGSGSDTQTVTVYPTNNLILTQPSNQSKVEGTDAQFLVVKQNSLTGTVSYQWYSDGIAISGANTETLTVTSVQQSDAGDYYVVVSLTDGGFTSSQSSNTVTLTVTLPTPPNISITPTSITATAGTAITSVTPTNSGGASTNWSITPTLPTGLTFNTSTGQISGTPTSSSTATVYTITAVNGGTQTSSTSITITVNAAPVSGGSAPLVSWNTPALSPIYVGTPANISLTVSNATVYSILTGALPPGLSLNPTTGAITGTPTTPGTYTFQILANNAYNTGQAQQFTLVVYPAQPVTPTNPTTPTTPTTDNSGNNSGGGSGSNSGSSGSGSGGSGSNGSGSSGNGNGNTGSTLPPLAPVVLTVSISNGSSVLTINGQNAFITLKPNSTYNGLIMTAPDFGLTLNAQDSSGNPIALAPNQSLLVQENQFVTTQGAGFLPNSDINIYIFSNPVLLGTVKSDSTGAFKTTLPLTSSIGIGNHTLQIVGYSVDKKVRAASIPLEVVKAAIVPVVKPLSAGVITFTKGSFVISSQAKKVLKSLNLAKAKSVTIYGYASNSRISDDMRISLDRAIEVRKQLQKIYPKLQIKTLGQGAKPIAACKSYQNLCAVVLAKTK